jgi:outer membrane lipoprotein-sorting protein
VKGTALLTWNYDDPAAPDDQWLYLPALRKSRRVALADRGRSFLGTDFSFDDMKRETQLSPVDYQWRSVGEETIDGHRCLVLEATPVSEQVASELGHGRALVGVDAELWIPRSAEYFGIDGAPQKRIRLLDVAQIQGIWTAQRIEAEDLVTGHRTSLRFRDVDYQAEIPEELFTEAALRRGAP